MHASQEADLDALMDYFVLHGHLPHAGNGDRPNLLYSGASTGHSVIPTVLYTVPAQVAQLPGSTGVSSDSGRLHSTYISTQSVNAQGMYEPGFPGLPAAGSDWNFGNNPVAADYFGGIGQSRGSDFQSQDDIWRNFVGDLDLDNVQ